MTDTFTIPEEYNGTPLDAEKLKQEKRTKLVLRVLPPSLTEDELEGALAKWRAQIEWTRFDPGEPSEYGSNPIFATAYVKFTTSSVAIEFSRAMDGAAFRDSKGVFTRTLVEWAVSGMSDPRPAIPSRSLAIPGVAPQQLSVSGPPTAGHPATAERQGEERCSAGDH